MAPAMAPARRLTTSGSSQCLRPKALVTLHMRRSTRLRQHVPALGAWRCRCAPAGEQAEVRPPHSAAVCPTARCSACRHTPRTAHQRGSSGPEPIQHGPGRPWCSPSRHWSGCAPATPLRGRARSLRCCLDPRRRRGHRRSRKPFVGAAGPLLGWGPDVLRSCVLPPSPGAAAFSPDHTDVPPQASTVHKSAAPTAPPNAALDRPRAQAHSVGARLAPVFPVQPPAGGPVERLHGRGEPGAQVSLLAVGLVLPGEGLQRLVVPLLHVLGRTLRHRRVGWRASRARTTAQEPMPPSAW